MKHEQVVRVRVHFFLLSFFFVSFFDIPFFNFHELRKPEKKFRPKIEKTHVLYPYKILYFLIS